MSEKKCPLKNFEKCIGQECAWFVPKNKVNGKGESCGVYLVGIKACLPLDLGKKRE